MTDHGSGSHSYADDAGSGSLVGTGYGPLLPIGGTSLSSPFTVYNVAPDIHLAGNYWVDEGSQYSLTFSATDPGHDTISLWRVAWVMARQTPIGEFSRDGR